MSLIGYVRHQVRTLFKPSSVFTDIYNNRAWRGTESASGRGSDTDQTERLVRELPGIFDSLGIQSLLDIPCGDMHWMRGVIEKADIRYIGGDIVEDLIEKNRKLYECDNISFLNVDLRNDELPKSDIIFSRDCLVHMSFLDAWRSLENISRSECKFVALTTFSKRNSNKDIITGRWRPLNMQAPPFSLPEPHIMLNEGCTEENGRYADKCLAIWKREALLP